MAKPWEKFQTQPTEAPSAAPAEGPWSKFQAPKQEPKPTSGATGGWQEAPMPAPKTPTASEIQAAAMREQYEQQAVPEAKTVPPTGRSQLELMADYMRPKYQQEAMEDPGLQARMRGIEAQGAPEALRAAYMKIPPNQRGKLSEILVNRYFQQRTNGNSDFVPVSYDEGLDAHLYKDPMDGKWKPLNDLGMDKEDAVDFMKYVVAPATASLAAGTGTAITGSPALMAFAALTADATTAGMMRADDVQELIDAGLLPPSVSPVFEGAKEAGWAVGGAMMGDIGGKFLRKGLTGVDNVPMAVDVDRKMINEMLQRFEKQYGNTMPKLTLDEKMGLVAKTPKEKAAALRVRSRKDSLQASGATKEAMLQRQQENEADFKAGLDNFLQVVGRKEDPAVFRASGLDVDSILTASQNIIDKLEKPAREKLKQYDLRLADAYTNAEKTLDDLLSDNMDPQRMPESFANAFTVARDVFDQNMRQEYNAIGEAVGSNKKLFNLAPLKEELRIIRRNLQSDAKFNKMMEDIEGFAPRDPIRDKGGAAQPDPDEDLMEAFFGSQFSKEGDSGLLVPDSVKRQRAEAPELYNYEDVNDALLQLRRRMRKLPANTDSKVWKTFSRVESALMGIRDKGLREVDPSLADSQKALDATYKIGMDTLDRGILKKLNNQYLEARPNQPGVLKPSTFDKLFKGDSGTETVRDLRTLVDEDVFATGVGAPINSLGVKDTVRKGLLGALRSEQFTTTVKGKGVPGTEATVLDPDKFIKFKKNYRDAIEYALSPEQVSRIENATGLKRALETAERQYKEAKDAIAAFPWGSKEIANDPTQLFRKTWTAKDETTDLTKYNASLQLREAMREAGDPAGLLSDYRKLIANDMMRNVQGAKGYVDPMALRQYLDDHQGLLKVWYTSPGQSGTDLVENLKTYSDIGRTIMETSGLTHSDKDALLEALNSVARAYVGVFTRAGRVLTAVKQLGGGASLRKEADFILNPEKYIKNQDFFEVLDSQEFRALQRAGGHAVMQILREDMGLPEQEPESQPLFGQ